MVGKQDHNKPLTFRRADVLPAISAAAMPLLPHGGDALHKSPHLASVLDCVVSDRLACAHVVARRVHVALCAATAAKRRAYGTAPEAAPPPAQKRTCFHALRAPSVTPSTYLHRLVKHSHCSRAAFITALIYLDRVALRRPELRLNGLNVHRLLLTATLLATKFLDDVLYDNAHFAFVGGLDVAELNHLELAFLNILDYRLHVTPQAFRDYEARLLHAVLASPNHAFHELREHLVPRKGRPAFLPPNSPISVADDN